MSGSDPRTYRFQQQLTSHGVITHLAARPDGRFVMVHVLTPMADPDHRQLLAEIDQFTARESAVVLDRLAFDDKRIGIVTELLKGFDSFEKWFARRTGELRPLPPSAAPTGSGPASQPGAPPPAKRPGEFTVLFGGAGSPVASPLPPPRAAAPSAGAAPARTPPVPPVLPVPPATPPAVPPPRRGTFTQIFGAQEAADAVARANPGGAPPAADMSGDQPTERVPHLPARADAEPATEHPTLPIGPSTKSPLRAKRGGHAQVIAAVPTPGTSPAQPATPAPKPDPQESGAGGREGSFTYLFGAPPQPSGGPANAPPAASPSDRRAAPSQPADPLDPLSSLLPPQATPKPGVSDTDFFRALESSEGPGAAGPPGVPPPPPSPPAKRGEFTMLMSGVGASALPSPPSTSPPPGPPAPPAQVPPMPAQPPRPAQPPKPPGPGEFTRIISAPPAMQPPVVPPPAAQKPPAAAAGPSQASAPQAAGSRIPLVIGAVLMLLIIVGMVLYFVLRSRPVSSGSEAQPTAQAEGSQNQPGRTQQGSGRS